MVSSKSSQKRSDQALPRWFSGWYEKRSIVYGKRNWTEQQNKSERTSKATAEVIGMVDVEDARRPITCPSDVQLFKVRRLLAGSRRDCRKACRPLDKGYFQAARRTGRPTVQVPSPISIVTTVCCRRTRGLVLSDLWFRLIRSRDTTDNHRPGFSLARPCPGFVWNCPRIECKCNYVHQVLITFSH